MNQQLLVEVTFTRIGVGRFAEKVNDLIASGWDVKTISIDKYGLRIICYALMEAKKSTTNKTAAGQ